MPLKSANHQGFVLFSESAQRNLLYFAIFVVSLWVSIDVTDSTILKPYILIGATLLLAAIWLSRSLAMGSIVLDKGNISFLVCTYFLALALSWALSPYRQFGAVPLLSFLGCLICFFAGTRLFRRRDHLDQAIDLLSLLSLLICLFALVQFFSGDSLGIRFGLGSSKRVMSTLGNSTYLAGFLAMMIVVLSARIAGSERGIRTTLTWILLGIMVIVLFLTQSRGAIIAAGVSSLLLFVFLKKGMTRRTFVRIIVVLILLGTAFLSFPGTFERFSVLTDPAKDFSLGRRVPFWTAGWNAFLASPLVGHGPGSIPFVVASFRSPDYWVNGSEDLVPHLHNEILEVGVETGLTGVLLYCIFFVLVLRKGMKEGSTDAVIAGMACGIIAILIDGMTGIALRHPPVAMITWLLAGILVSRLFRDPETIEWRIPAKLGRATAALPVVAWGVMALFIGMEAVDRLDSDRALQHGRVAQKAGHREIALEHFRYARERSPSYLIASFDLCVAQLKTGKYREALSTGSAIRSLVPDYPKIGLLESLAWLQLDSLNQASEAITRELRRRDHPEAYYTQSLIAAKLDDTVQVRQSLEKVLERNIGGYTGFHLESTARTLLEIAGTRQDLERLNNSLQQLAARQPNNDAVVDLLREVRRRLDKRPTP